MNLIHSKTLIFFSKVMLLVLLCKCYTPSSLNYTKCLYSAHCADYPVIPYPFSVSQGCGHPGFQLHCQNHGTLLLKINQGVYKILSFPPPYSKFHQITIADGNLFGRCGLPNVTFNPKGSAFALAEQKDSEVVTLFIGCPIKLPKQYPHFPRDKSCAFPKYNQSYYRYSHANDQFNMKNNTCISVIQVPLLNNTRANKKPLHELLLEGFKVEWNTSDAHFDKCKGCQRTGGICGYNEKQLFVCYCRSGVFSDNCHSGNRTDHRGKSHRVKSQLGVIIGGCIGCSLLIVIAATYAALYMRKKVPPPPDESIHTGNNMEAALACLSLQVFTYKELEAATNFFDENRQLGDGGFGCVYEATLKNGQKVAVKRLYPDNSKRAEQFVNEIRVLSSLCHPNLVHLIGFCQYRYDLLLVYEYVPNGTLADHLYGERRGPEGLPWETRLNIALQIAKALEYLHFSVSPPVFHRDIKSGNILLDKEFGVKLADFGLCRLVPLEASHICTVPQGTPGYLDPDYNESYQLTDKSDVYSFGVVLFEIITGLKAVDTTRGRREINLASLAIAKIQCGTLHEIIDPSLEIELNPLVHAMVGRVCELGFACLAMRKEDRPDMMEVVVQLEQITRIGHDCSEDFTIEKDSL